MPVDSTARCTSTTLRSAASFGRITAFILPFACVPVVVTMTMVRTPALTICSLTGPVGAAAGVAVAPGAGVGGVTGAGGGGTEGVSAGSTTVNAVFGFAGVAGVAGVE